MTRPNVLWIMSDQHNAGCLGCEGHPVARTPNLDRIAARGVRFTQAFCNNPICSPSRISFMTGQYAHTHQMFGNTHDAWPEPNPDTLACLFRRQGYQTALIGKSHMTRRWDADGFEHIRYTDLCDADAAEPRTSHYFDHLVGLGLGDWYEEGVAKPGQDGYFDGSRPAALPYEHSIEHYTGEQTLAFLRTRDAQRPFFAKMSFQRPHDPITPAPEHFDRYDPTSIPLPDNALDYFQRRFAGKPAFQEAYAARGGAYPLADPDPARLRRALASYFALISAIDDEVGRVLDELERSGERDRTVVFYTADHGDFAGEHGLLLKNFGIYESIHRIPFLLSWPGGPRNTVCDALVESVDWYPTLCALCGVPAPEGREGIALSPVATGTRPARDAAFCEWDGGERGRVVAIRTPQARLVFYPGLAQRGEPVCGELYDHSRDPGEVENLWCSAEHAGLRRDLTERLFAFCLGYQSRSDERLDRQLAAQRRHTPTALLHKGGRYWSGLQRACTEPTRWPPVPKSR